MLLAIILGALSLVDLIYVFQAWVKPQIARHFQFEPGRDNEVSWREGWRRSAWRYDSWIDRILSILGFVLLSIAWLLVLIIRV